MIILIHGTGDDDKKAENWMPWVAKIMRLYGETVLVLPGVASSRQNDLGAAASVLLTGLGVARAGHNTVQSTNTDLRDSLREAGGEVLLALNVLSGNEEGFIQYLVANKRPESGNFTSGIKIRIAIGSLCALAYYRRKAVATQRPIRIIGHSRGGCVAVGIHNVLTSYGIPCNHTLTLDPCHGVDRVVVGATLGAVAAVPVAVLAAPVAPIVGFAAITAGAARGNATTKDYYHTIWAGHLVNLPCEKGVGADWAGFAVFRPPITDEGTAVVTNLPKLREIKHGHMGKLRSLHGSSEGVKDSERVPLRARMNPCVARPMADAGSHLDSFFDQFLERGAAYSDKRAIFNELRAILT